MVAKKNFGMWIRAALTALVLLLPAGASAQQARPIAGIPLPTIQIEDGGVLILPLPGVLPGIRVPSQVDGNRPWPTMPGVPSAAPEAPSGPVAPTPLPTPPVAAPAPVVPPVFDAPAAPDAPSPGDAVGRVYGVFVGITDYPSASDLPFCADDAVRVQQAFVQAGIIDPLDTVVLRDHQATRAAVRGALEQATRRMGPNDTLVFFFSGHGNQIPDQNADERDGQDETVILADGPLVDDELATLLSTSRGREIVALDSCYSGGFQQDLARLPDTAGFYASREDQVSYVADEYQAGGYLSYYFAESVRQSGGHPLTVSQLQQDIADGYAQSGASSRQELTIGVSRSVNSRSVLFSGGSSAPAMVASR